MRVNHFQKHIYVKKPVEYSATMTNMHFFSAVLSVGGLLGKTKLRKNILTPRERGFFFSFFFFSEVTGSKVCLNEADGRKEQKRLVYLSSPLRMEGDSLAAV